MTKPQWHKDVKEAILCSLSKEAGSFTSDPVYQTTGGWYYCDEAWADSFGPFSTESEARVSRMAYEDAFRAETKALARHRHVVKPLFIDIDPRKRPAMRFEIRTKDGYAFVRNCKLTECRIEPKIDSGPPKRGSRCTYHVVQFPLSLKGAYVDDSVWCVFADDSEHRLGWATHVLSEGYLAIVGMGL